MKMRLAMTIIAAAAMAACGANHDAEHGDVHGSDVHAHGATEAESWAVTAWGQHFELFPEIDALAAGKTAGAHVHVTVLDCSQGRRRCRGAIQRHDRDPPWDFQRRDRARYGRRARAALRNRGRRCAGDHRRRNGSGRDRGRPRRPRRPAAHVARGRRWRDRELPQGAAVAHGLRH
jgi:hypothetical protein